jgi:hypothetical protein
MKSLRGARVVVAADEFSGRTLVNLLTRMHALQVRRVATIIEAQALCQAGEGDACLVAIRNFQIEDVPARTVEEPAPSSSAILLADVVTPDVVRAARRSGYVSVAALTVAPRLICRLICGALQKARRRRPPVPTRGGRPAGMRSHRQAAMALRIGYFGASPVPAAGYGKVKLSS